MPHLNDRDDSDDWAVVAAIRQLAGVQACWVSTRDGRDRVYLIQVGASAAVPVLPGAARVEVFREDADLSARHRLALRTATLRWCAAPAPVITVARVFDGADEKGPWFDRHHELVVDPRRRGRLLDFLAAGEVVLTAEHRLPDVLAGDHDAVPTDLRSDGHWVWSEAVAYYLDRYHLAPEPGLAEHASTATPGGALSPLARHHVWQAMRT